MKTKNKLGYQRRPVVSTMKGHLKVSFVDLILRSLKMNWSRRQRIHTNPDDIFLNQKKD